MVQQLHHELLRNLFSEGVMLLSFKKITLGLILLLLAGCAGPTLKPVEFGADADPNNEISLLDQDLKLARSEQTDIASPHYFKMAGKHFGEAKELREKQKDNSAILKEVGLAKAALNKAKALQNMTQEQFSDVMKARSAAIEAGAANYKFSELKKIDARFKDVTEEFESQAARGKSFSNISLSQRDTIKKDYAELESEALTSKYLGRAQTMIENAEKNQASIYAPKSLNLARSKYRDAARTIANNRQDIEAIEKAAGSATAEAEKLMRVTMTAKSARGLSSEDIALDIESKKEALSESEMTSEKRAKMIKERNAQLAGALNENQELRRKEEFEAALARAQEMFKPEEADVYRQGNKILIRLKAANFVSGRADVSRSAYPVLGKVKNLLSEVGARDIVIEGHTDITGSKEKNIELSKERADAVADYLTNNAEIKPDQITTEGFGFDKPLAPNNTKKGRAQNRRVDIIVTPSVVR